ncbi:TetR/AcrR family transcriptional regulator [Piscinibacter gummiphilus]|uniref:TetR/AcrR family transcriptional regulator n=1 Tax=Piscinibacter gummiphilus TaxID=946333 RepID=A0ABZ0CLY7_9BURK|nr:TetR/AcrR family transcriptional regulator [Piscinibacter gummiphilus]WOB05995.1 TetR/AcrR family transcriptional regulator [Piscinibacter gummiphilus]
MPPRTPATPPKRRTQTERKQDAEQRLLDSAVELIGRKGVNGMTLSEVGEMAGYSRGLVSHHYGSREAFLRVVAQSLRQRFVDAEQQTHHEPGLDALIANVELYLSGTGPASRAVNVMLTEAIVGGGSLLEDMRAFTATSRKFYANQIRLGIERGEMRKDLDPEAQAVMILGMLRGVAAQALLDDKVQKSKLRSEIVATIRRMLVA